MILILCLHVFDNQGLLDSSLIHTSDLKLFNASTNMILIGVHLGAGQYGRQTKKSFESLVKECLESGMQCFKTNPKDLISVAEGVMTTLEESGLVNTGKGSSLTNKLNVECDAIMMRGSDGAIGSIIASPDNENPSATAAHLLRQSCMGLEYGQILRPCILVGEEASRYSKQHNLWKPCRISEKRFNQGKEYQSILEKSKHTTVEDTVGCIILSDEEIVVAGSSGGNWMRAPGRGGLCSVPGAGVWCEDQRGCVCSGFGECCIRTLLAKRVCDVVCNANDIEAKIEQLFNVTLVDDIKRMNIQRGPSFGILSAFRSKTTQKPQLIIAHNSKHFAYGYVLISEDQACEMHIHLSETKNAQCNIQWIHF